MAKIENKDIIEALKEKNIKRGLQRKIIIV